MKQQPEEEFRRDLVNFMTEELGFPKALVSIEVSLHTLPHLQHASSSIPRRRADIVVWAKGVHPQWELYPLLVIECKASKLSEAVVRQVVGYNHLIEAYFWAVANREECWTAWWDEEAQEYSLIKGLPHYEELLTSISRS